MNGLPLRPEVCTLPSGRIGVFLGADYKFLTREAAQALRDKLDDELSKPAPAAVDRTD